MSKKCASQPTETKHPKTHKDFPSPTMQILKTFPFKWETPIGATWKRGNYEHFLFGSYRDKRYLFVLKGSTYGRRYHLFEVEANNLMKPLIKVLNLSELELYLKALTNESESKGFLIEHMLHPSPRIRELAKKISSI
jgi:hypothetical protein